MTTLQAFDDLTEARLQLTVAEQDARLAATLKHGQTMRTVDMDNGRMYEITSYHGTLAAHLVGGGGTPAAQAGSPLDYARAELTFPPYRREQVRDLKLMFAGGHNG